MSSADRRFARFSMFSQSWLMLGKEDIQAYSRNDEKKGWITIAAHCWKSLGPPAEMDNYKKIFCDTDLETRPKTCSSLHIKNSLLEDSYFQISVCILFVAVGPWNFHLPSTSGRHGQILNDGWKWPRLRGGDTFLCLLRELVRPVTRVLLTADGIICPRARRLPASLTRPPTGTLTTPPPPTPDELEPWTLRSI